MRREIETVPKDGKLVILQDDARGTYELARWSTEQSAWVGENGKPIPIAPTHWLPLQRDERAMNIFKEKRNRAVRRITQSDTSFLYPQIGLRSNGRRRRKMPLRLGRIRGRLSLSRASSRGPRPVSPHHPHGADLQSPQSPQP